MSIIDFCRVQGGNFGRRDGAVEGEVRRAPISLIDDALVVLLCDQVRNLFVRHSFARCSNRIYDLP